MHLVRRKSLVWILSGILLLFASVSMGDDKLERESAQEGGGAGLKACAACGNAQPRESYSNKQWTAKAHRRRCNSCVENDVQPRGQGDAASTSAPRGGKQQQQQQQQQMAGVDGGQEVQDDELTALIKAIYFADPATSLKKATREAASKYKSLGMTPPSAGEVGEVWKTLGLDKQNDDTLLKLWTIGVNPAVASDKTCTGQAGGCAGEEEAEADEGVWFPVELDVPGNQSGKMPYQALINFNKNTGGQQRGRFGEIFKVQVAQGAPPGSPMLMYNKERTRKTFIHSSAPGYSEIKDAVVSSGTHGTLGVEGGQKAFFNGRFDRKKDVVLLMVSELAEPQPW